MSLTLVVPVAVVLIPGLLFGGLLLQRYAEAERAGNAAAVENLASRAADALDRELAGIIASLDLLAASPALHAGDFAALTKQAEPSTGLDAHRQSRALVVTGANGAEFLRTGGTPQQVFWASAPGQRPASNLVTGNGQSFIRIAAPPNPAGRSPAGLQTVSFELGAPVFVATLQAQNLPRGWVAALVDGNDTVISRSVDADRFLGQTAPADFRAQAVNDGGSWRGVNLAGTPVISGYSRVQLAPWRVVVGAPIALVEQRLDRALLTLTGGGLFLALLSTGLALRLARQVSVPLHALAGAGEVLARGDILPPVATRVREVAHVASALRTASIALRSRTEALGAERSRLAAIIETVPVGLLIVNADMTVASVNAHMAEITGTPASQSPASQSPASQSPASQSPANLPARNPLALDLRMADGSPPPAIALPPGRALRGEANPELECRLYRPDGTSVWVYLIAAPIRDRTGAVTAAVVAVLDVEEVVRARDEKARSALLLERQVADRTVQLETANTRLRDEIRSRTEAEAQLRQVQKMEAVGQLTGGIAHDFNNLLTIVIGCLDMLHHRLNDDRARRLADNALDGAQRAAVLTARLLAFSRQQPLMPRALDLNSLVAGLSDLLARTLGEHVRFHTALPPNLWRVYADPNQVENVLLNLANNSKDAIAGLGPDARGELHLSTANAVLAPGDFVDVAPGDYVRVTVLDTGAGMPPDVIARVFEPFFTTKPIGQGTGLGLSQVHGFVKQSGGHVEIASRVAPDPNPGTAVILYLPREPLAAEVPEAPAPLHPASIDTARFTVLVVEDEPGVRSFACEALADLGYTVVAAGDVTEALDLLAQTPAVDLLFTDMILPETSGRTLADEARRRRPGLPILYTTGYTKDLATREGRLRPGEALIDKPYTVRELATALAALLPA